MQIIDIKKQNVMHSVFSLANNRVSGYPCLMEDIKIDSILSDMDAAGCSAADMERLRCAFEAGMEEEIVRCLRKCRCRMLDELHEKQRNVDRIDKLIRKTQNTTIRARQ